MTLLFTRPNPLLQNAQAALFPFVIEREIRNHYIASFLSSILLLQYILLLYFVSSSTATLKSMDKNYVNLVMFNITQTIAYDTESNGCIDKKTSSCIYRATITRNVLGLLED